MLSPETYREAYGLAAFEVLPGWPPIFLIPTPLGGPILTSSPYVTETPFPGGAAAEREWPAFVEGCRALLRDKRARYLLLKLDRPVPGSVLDAGFALERRYSKTRLDLSGGREHVWSRVIHARTRNKIRKGERANPAMRLGGDELLDDHYRVTAVTQTQLGTPVHARRYYAAILRHNPDARLLVLYLEGRPVSTALLIVRGGTIHHPHTGTLNAAKHTRVNHVLYWRIIEHGLATGCRWFDMGRSIRGSGNEAFKRTWGGREEQVPYAYLLPPGAAVPDYGSSLIRLATSLWRYVPPAVAAAVGHRFIRTVP